VTLVAVNAVVDVSRHVRVTEVSGIVAAVAAGALEYGVIVGIDVARGANTVGIAMVNRESRVLRVIECRAGPGCGVVAVLARGREELLLRRVAGIGGVVVIGLMAADTSRGQRGVVAVDVAVGAYPRRCLVRAGEGECRIVVIERGVCPDGGVVAQFARGRESGRRVRGIVRSRVVLLVARVAQGVVQRIVVVDMAIDALPRWDGVTSRQREAGTAVIEGGICP